MNLAPGSMQSFEVCKIRDTKFPFDGIIVEVTEHYFGLVEKRYGYAMVLQNPQQLGIYFWPLGI